MRLLLARHGESEWNAIGRWQGRADPPLSARGRAQATMAVATLGVVDAIIASTLQRALDTALIISDGLGVGPVVLEPDLQERDAGEWEGLTRVQIDDAWPGYLAARQRPPGYEIDGPLLARVCAALDRIGRAMLGADILVVTHGGVINALEASFGVPWERVPNLGGRWFGWSGGELCLGERVELIDHAALTAQERDQV